MVRVVAFDIFLFLLPFVIYALYLFATRKTVGTRDDWTLKVVGWLALAGAVLIVVVLLLFIHFDTSPPGGVYVPAHMENGVLIPGQFVPAE